MKCAVVGPGALGCLWAALLARGGHEVTLLDRDPARAAALTRQGLRLETGAGTLDCRIPCTAEAGRIGCVDLVCLCVKAYATALAAPLLPPLVDDRTLVLSLQNGLGNLELLADALRTGCLLGGSTTHGATLLGPGHIRHAGQGLTVVAPWRIADYPRAAALAEVFQRCEIKTTTHENLTAVLWSKLIINAAIGPVAALSGLRNGPLARHAHWGEVLRAAVREGAAVAAAQGIALLYADPVAAVLEVCRRTADNVASMLQDVRRGRRTELDAINGALVRAAERVGVPVPVQRDLMARLFLLLPGGRLV